MKVCQYAIDWKEDWDFKVLTKLAKIVGGRKCLQDYAQDVVDCKVMYISSRSLTDQELNNLWHAVELWGFDGPVEGRTFKEVLKKLQYRADTVLMRDDLVLHDEDDGPETVAYRNRIWKMSPKQVRREYERQFGNKKPGEE